MVYNSTGISCGRCSGQFMQDHIGPGHAHFVPVDNVRPPLGKKVVYCIPLQIIVCAMGIFCNRGWYYGYFSLK